MAGLSIHLTLSRLNHHDEFSTKPWQHVDTIPPLDTQQADSHLQRLNQRGSEQRPGEEGGEEGGREEGCRTLKEKHTQFLKLGSESRQEVVAHHQGAMISGEIYQFR